MIKQTIEAACDAWLPTNPPRPCPLLLTEEEAIVFLRLDQSGSKNPDGTLAYYREAGLLKGCRVGKKYSYRLADLKAFIEEMSNRR